MSEIEDSQVEKSLDKPLNFIKQLSHEIHMQESALAVLGNADENSCTYKQGYLPRQPLYACHTCKLNDNKYPIICYACTIHCHDNHKLIELYTKRNIRCDCPVLTEISIIKQDQDNTNNQTDQINNDNTPKGQNKSIPITPDNSPNLNYKPKLKLSNPIKCALNNSLIASPNSNKYSQNSQKGTYCLCEKPYPDFEDEIEDDMYQCITCEDWFHGRHLFDFKMEGNEVVIDEKIVEQLEMSNVEIICLKCIEKFNFIKNENHICKIQSNQQSNNKTLIIQNTRRQEWAECENCKQKFDDEKLQFLYKYSDSIQVYEQGQISAINDQAKKEINLNPHNQLLLASGIKDLKEGFKQYLEQYEEPTAKKAKIEVSVDDVQEFFKGISEKNGS